MAAGQKKVIVRPLGHEPMAGYLPGSDFVASGTVEFLDPAGRLSSLPVNQIKTIAFVKDFNLDDPLDPERLGPKLFPARPRTAGLWMRVTFTDGDVLEGLAATDISLFDGLLHETGVFLTPPSGKGNTQRIFVPRSALRSAELLAVIGTAAKKPSPPPAEGVQQPRLFED